MSRLLVVLVVALLCCIWSALGACPDPADCPLQCPAPNPAPQLPQAQISTAPGSFADNLSLTFTNIDYSYSEVRIVAQYQVAGTATTDSRTITVCSSFFSFFILPGA